MQMSINGCRMGNKAHSGAADPGRDDVLAWSPDIDNGAVVGERSTGIGDGCGSNGVGGWGTSRGCAASVGVGIARSNGGVNTSVGNL